MLKRGYHETMKLVLKPHSSTPKNETQISGEIKRLGRKIIWKMELTPGRSWYVNPLYGDDPRKNWELWNWDVVEAFLQLRTHVEDIKAPYLELQISPRGQMFCLVILRPREAFFTPLNLAINCSTESIDGCLVSTVEVELPEDLVGEELWGGLFSCLGASPREFYALNPNPEERADFHRPELFKRLD
jgi:hypothetical protein